MKIIGTIFVVLFCTFNYTHSQNINSKMSYTEEEILNEIDSVTALKMFPNFDLYFNYQISSKINLFADDTRWAIVIEVTEYEKLNFIVSINKYYFGNCLVKKEGNLTNISSVIIFQESPNVFDDNGNLTNNAKSIRIREKEIQIDRDLNKYKENKIKGLYFNDTRKNIDVVALMRLINNTHPDLMSATLTELQTDIPKDIPFIGSIDKWYHQNYSYYQGQQKYLGIKPSSYETFQMISKVLVNRNMQLYKPTLKPNSNWQNWPKAGTI